MNVISDHTNISVASRLVEDYDANGRHILNYEVSFTYDVAPGLLGAGRLPLRQVPRGAVGRRLQSMHYDGITEAALYPEVLAAQRAIRTARHAGTHRH